MAITSFSFILFLCFVFIIYFALPKKLQWIVLLVASVIFYLFVGINYFVYVLITTSTVYVASIFLEYYSDKQKKFLKLNKEILSKEEKSQYKKKNTIKKKIVLILALVISIGLLCVFKYLEFAIEQINIIATVFDFGDVLPMCKLIAPLGISFYTFQAVGYMLDVYWEYYKPERNYLKMLLFVSFFPQITQGPISEFENFKNEVFAEHTLNYKNFTWGFQRLVWGFFKKMLIADVVASAVKDVFANYSNYAGITVLFGAFLYSIQIYADFSGYMDIMCGFCEMLGIKLTENFERPYFSKSVTEYWRRWHISLGAWFKKYIYYPIGMSNWSRKFAKNTIDKFGKHFANSVPATIALILVWFATGLWHGASWAYIAWGGVNGAFIIFSLWMEPLYISWKSGLRISDENLVWRCFQVIRTFVLVTFIKVLPEVGTLSDGLGLWRSVFANHYIPKTFEQLLPFFKFDSITSNVTLIICFLGVGMMLVVSLVQRKRPFREYFNRIPVPIRSLVLAVVVMLICSFGVRNGWGAGGFLYAAF